MLHRVPHLTAVFGSCRAVHPCASKLQQLQHPFRLEAGATQWQRAVVLQRATHPVARVALAVLLAQRVIWLSATPTGGSGATPWPVATAAPGLEPSPGRSLSPRSSAAKLRPWTDASTCARPASSAKVRYSDTTSTTWVLTAPIELGSHGARMIRGVRVAASKTLIFSHMLCSPSACVQGVACSWVDGDVQRSV